MRATVGRWQSAKGHGSAHAATPTLFSVVEHLPAPFIMWRSVQSLAAKALPQSRLTARRVTAVAGGATLGGAVAFTLTSAKAEGEEKIAAGFLAGVAAGYMAFGGASAMHDNGLSTRRTAINNLPAPEAKRPDLTNPRVPGRPAALQGPEVCMSSTE